MNCRAEIGPVESPAIRGLPEPCEQRLVMMEPVGFVTMSLWPQTEMSELVVTPVLMQKVDSTDTTPGMTCGKKMSNVCYLAWNQ